MISKIPKVVDPFYLDKGLGRVDINVTKPIEAVLDDQDSSTCINAHQLS